MTGMKGKYGEDRGRFSRAPTHAAYAPSDDTTIATDSMGSTRGIDSPMEKPEKTYLSARPRFVSAFEGPNRPSFFFFFSPLFLISVFKQSRRLGYLYLWGYIPPMSSLLHAPLIRFWLEGEVGVQLPPDFSHRIPLSLTPHPNVYIPVCGLGSMSGAAENVQELPPEISEFEKPDSENPDFPGVRFPGPRYGGIAWTSRRR